jgi:hypothetical protein
VAAMKATLPLIPPSLLDLAREGERW